MKKFAVVAQDELTIIYLYYKLRLLFKYINHGDSTIDFSHEGAVRLTSPSISI